MDSKANGADSDFVVFVDSIQQTINETTSSTTTTDRTIQIPFEQGTQTIEVVGTYMVPEFGSIAAIILAVSVVGIIVATTKFTNRFSFLTRF
jgi:predicted secreted protein with PEFG-CTERM motif